MKTAVLAVLMIVSASLCAATKNKGGIGPQTDFKNMPPEQVLALLQNASDLTVKGKGGDFDGCNGRKKTWEGSREQRCSDVGIGLGTIGTQGEQNLRKAELLLPTMTALFRGCGLYAGDLNNSFGGKTCSQLGEVFFIIGNKEAAAAVWELAPGCYGYNRGVQINGCFYTASVVAPGDTAVLARIARKSCETLHDRGPCEYLLHSGERVDMGAVEQAESDNRETVQEYRAEKQAQFEAAQNRQSTLLTVLQSMPGANNPNAVLNAGNRQAAAIRRIGDAYANQPPVAAANTISPLATTATNSSGAAVSQSALGHGNEQGSSEISGGSGSTGFTGTSGAVYANPLASTCVSTFWDPKYYNWLSFQNNCGQAIYLSFIFNSGKYGFSAMNLASGAAGNTGQSQNEVNAQGGYRVAVCPSGYFPVDSSTGHAITQPNQNFRCKKQ